MSPVPPDRASLDGVTVPPTQKTVEAQSPQARPAHKDPEQIGQYRILGKIGEGGMGIVYKAEQREPVRRVVALKVIKLGMDTREVVARFEAERQALALMNHPNVAKVFEAGMTESGRPYFAMELVPGIALTRYCDDEKLTIRQRLDLFIPVCQAIQHAHQKGIIHRDLKPSNILVQLIDGKPVPKVIDFGVAKATNQALTQHTLYTQTGTLVGTPEYMSPEQAMTGGLDVDTRTDIYSLGVILYELLSGTLPIDSKTLRSAGLEGMARLLKEMEPQKPSTQFSGAWKDGNDPEDRLKQIAKSRRGEPQALRRELGGDLDWIALKAMEKERSRRYETANGLAMDIQRHLDDEPVLARPPSTLYRFQKLVRRNRLAFAGASAFLLALLMGLITSTWLFVRELEARHRAVAAEQEQILLRQEAQHAQSKAQSEELSARRKAYASDMNLIQQALAMNNLGRARDLLNRQRPRADQSDLRGWEWRYLWQQCRGDASYVLCNRPDPIWSLAVSHDGRWAAVSEQENGALSIWDLRTRRQAAVIAAGDAITRIAFSPTQPLLAFTKYTGATRSYSICLWDPENQRSVGEVSLDGPAFGLGFSADGQTLAASVGSPGNQIVLWQVGQPAPLTRVRLPGVGNNFAIPFAIAGNMSIAAYVSGLGCRVVDLANGKELWTVKPLTGTVQALAISPDGRTLALGEAYSASPIRLFDIPSGKELPPLEGHRGWIGQLVFWPDGKKLASASSDQTIRLWDMTTRRPLAVLRGHNLEVWRLALLPDNKTLISGSKDGSVCLWDTAANHSDRVHLSMTSVAGFCFTPDSRSIVLVHRDGRVEQREGAEFQMVRPLLELRARVTAASVLYEHRLVAAGLPNGSVQFWDLDRPEMLSQLQTLPTSEHQQRFVSHRNRLTFGYTTAGLFRQWDPLTRQEGRNLRAPAQYSAAAFSPDGRRLFAIGWMGAAVVHDLISGQETSANLDIKEANNAVISPDGTLVACASERGPARIWDLPTLREVATFGGLLQGAHSVAFSPDGRRLAVGSGAREAVKLWDLQSGQEVLTLEGEEPIFEHSAFSPDGAVIASLSRRSVLELWRAPSWAEIEAAEKN